MTSLPTMIGNAQPRFFDGEALAVVDCLGQRDVEERTHAASAQQIFHVVAQLGEIFERFAVGFGRLFLRVVVVAVKRAKRVGLHQLADLFGQGHLGQQRIYTRFGGRVEVVVGSDVVVHFSHFLGD
jgi:hypothetical protein